MSEIQQPQNEKHLLQSIKAKEESAFNHLYENYSSAIYGVIIRIVPEQELAEEVLQDTFLKIWNKVDQYQAGKGRLYTWMYNIARNLAIDKVRSKEYNQMAVTDILDYGFQTNNRKNEPFETMNLFSNELLSYLTPAQSLVMNLMYFKGYTSEDVAKEYDIPQGTVKSRVRAALKTLRDVYGVTAN
ncbi:MAG: sigma-70 family RNA polymerase sigma factor [Cyclobacteriaceae bacterium]|nr:sigma-70 family RNA polymerase sigma factor [Cyclobacteriaceae bacterium HetDA_MAG_MS6]